MTPYGPGWPSSSRKRASCRQTVWTSSRATLAEARSPRRSPNAGLAPGALAERFGLPLVNAAAIEVDQDAAEQIPFHILERACALPYRVQHDRLSIVVADPSDVQTMDELRLATRYQLDVGVGSRDDIGIQLRNLSRAQEVWERAVLVEDDVLVVEAEPDFTELEADDGVSDAPLVRLVNSLVLQAAEDGASDLHFVP